MAGGECIPFRWASVNSALRTYSPPPPPPWPTRSSHIQSPGGTASGGRGGPQAQVEAGLRPKLKWGLGPSSGGVQVGARPGPLELGPRLSFGPGPASTGARAPEDDPRTHAVTFRKNTGQPLGIRVLLPSQKGPHDRAARAVGRQRLATLGHPQCCQICDFCRCVCPADQ